MVFDGFPSTYRKDLEGIREEGNGFYAWGAVPGDMNTLRWNQMKQGDYVLSSYDNAYHHAARVLAKYDNRRFAERVWGRDNEGRTWRYMYFLTEPVEIDRRVPEVADYLNAGYRGFTRIRPDKVDAIVSEFGSGRRVHPPGAPWPKGWHWCYACLRPSHTARHRGIG
jgi:hypothetical protein